MNVVVFETYDTLCLQIANEICGALAKNPHTLLCIAAGHTSIGVFHALYRANRDGRVDFSNAAFVAMDEWCGMDWNTAGSCGYLLQKEFLSRINIRQNNIRLVNGLAPDSENECRSLEQFIKEHSSGRIDYLVLGSGMNGHLALNEPDTPFGSRAHTSTLSATTLQVGQKYFEKQTDLQGGLTLGIANFNEAYRKVLMISGQHKHNICEQILRTPPTAALPATVVKTWENASIYVDKGAAETGVPAS